MSTAQDIYDSLINNPDYQEANGLTREKVVEREAKRRALQHHNNELALSMAVQNSAIDKLLHFVNSPLLQKALDDFDKKLLSNKMTIGGHLGRINEELEYFHDDPKIETTLAELKGRLDKGVSDEQAADIREQISELEDAKMGWGTDAPSTISERDMITLPDILTGDPKNISIYHAGKLLSEKARILRRIMEGLTQSKPEGLRDIFTDADTYSIVRKLFTDDGTIPVEHEKSLQQFIAHPSIEENKELIKTARDEDAGGDLVPGATPPTASTLNKIDAMMKREPRKGAIQTLWDGDPAEAGGTLSDIPEERLQRYINHVDAMMKIGRRRGEEDVKERDARRIEHLNNFDYEASDIEPQTQTTGEEAAIGEETTDEEEEPSGTSESPTGSASRGIAPHWTDDKPGITRILKDNIQRLEAGEPYGTVFPGSTEGRADGENYDKFMASVAGTVDAEKHYQTLSDAEPKPTTLPIPDAPTPGGTPTGGGTENILGNPDEPVTLEALNQDHINHAIETQNLDRSTFDVKSQADFTDENGELQGNWDKIFLGGTPPRMRGSSKKLAADKELITLDEDTGKWDWTEKGRQELLPALAAMHKFYTTTSSDNPNVAQPDEGFIRTSTFAKLINAWEAGRLNPDEFSKEKIMDEHNNEDRQAYRADPLAVARRLRMPVEEEDDDEDKTPQIIDHENINWDEFVNGSEDGSTRGLPHELNHGEGKLLIPKDEDGNDYNPETKNLTPEQIMSTYNKLKEIYADIHEFDPENPTRPALLEGYFPVSRRGTNKRDIDYDKKNFTPDQIIEYNKLNTNKDITEQWLFRFASLLRTQEGKSWQWKDIWPGEQPSAPAQWAWYRAFEMMGKNYRPVNETDHEDNKETIKVDGKDTEVVSTLDKEGNFNYHSIPMRHAGYGANFDSGRYTNRTGHAESWMGLHYIPSSDVVMRNLLQTEPTKEGFGVGSHITNAHIKAAFKDWTEQGASPGETSGAKKARTALIGNFLNWMHQKVDGKPRHELYTGQSVQPPTPTEEAEDVEGDPFKEEQLKLFDGPSTEEQVPPDDLPSGEAQVADETPEQKEARDAEEKLRREEQQKQDAYKQKLIDQLMAQEYKNGVEKGSEDEETHRDYLESLLPDQLRNEHVKHVVEANRMARRDAAKAGVKAEEAEAKEPSALDDDTRQRLINEYINTYREMYDQPYDSRRIAVLQEASDKDLQQEHKKLLDELGNHQREKSLNLKTGQANNIAFNIKPLAPLQEHLTKEDILMQARRLTHHSAAYGKLMGPEAKKIWDERWAEVHQLADAANMDLNLRLHQDMEEAAETGDFGSTNWLNRVGEAHEETLNRRNAHRDAVSRGSELRTNVNYKPHIIATYGDDGNFQGFHNLKTNEGVDQFNLRFTDDDHYQFHGLDPEKVKKYQKYLALKEQAGKERPPGELPLAFGPPSAPANPELAELEKEMRGTEYRAIQDRFSTIGNLPGAQQIFNDKFTKDAYGRHGTPVNPDGSGMAVPRFYRGISDNVGEQGWYHPESESWINPHRYRELINHMGGQPNSGRVVLSGKHFYGKGIEGEHNPVDPKYAFAIPTEAKSQQFRSGYDDQGYYLDDTGAIAHVHDTFEAGNMQSHDQPQNVNGVIHDWYAQQIGNQAKANPKAFRDEQGNPRQVAVIDTPPPTSSIQPPPIQNMWLELQALGRESGSALKRREQKKQSGWEWFDRKLGQSSTAQGYKEGLSNIKEGISRARHPFSSVARDPLSQQELGQHQWWSRQQEAKQKYFDVVDWAKFPAVSWLGKLLVGGETPEDKVIRRVRQGYQQQATTEKLTRETAAKITMDGQRLSEHYVAPGEQKARDEDYQELKRYFTNQVNFHQNQKDKNKGNKAVVESHDAQRAKWTGFNNTLGQYDSKMPNHWKDINDMYTTHLGKVNQALPADASLNEWGTIMSQPSGNRWGEAMRQPDEGQPDEGQSTQTGETLPLAFGTTGERRQLPLAFNASPSESEKISAASSV